MQRKIERLVSGQARKLASPEHPLHFLLYSSNKHLQEDSKYVDLQVGKQVWYNVPRRMRQELWLSVLHKHKGAGATAAKQYATLVRQALPVDVDADIEKDVGRTFPNAARFATEAGKLSLLRVLRAYAVYDTEVGYCQGMNFLAALLLTWMPNEATAFGGLLVLMQQRMLRDLYKSDLAKLQVYLWQFSKLLPTGLGRHIEGHGVLPVLYLSSWLLTSFASDFPLFFSSRVLDVVLTGSYPHAVLKVAMTLLTHCGKALLALDDMEQVVHYLKAEVPNWSREVLQDILSDALSRAWSPAQEAILSNEAGMETVIDAVGRVNAAAQDNVAYLAAASQQAEQSQDNTSASSSAPGLATPPKHSVQAQQPSENSPGAASPLPFVPGKGALSSVRSASWTARLRSLPSSPSLPVPASPAPVERDRRHTTEEAAHHSGLPDSQGQPVPQPAAQKQPVTQQASHERFASEHWSDRQTTHKEAAVGGEQRNADETSGPPNSVSTSWSNSGILADGQTPGMSHIVDLPGSRQVAAAAADDDLLSFQADPQDTQGVWQGHDSHQQQGNGLLQHEQLGSIQQQGHDALHCDGLGSQSEALNSSTMWRSSLAESQQLSFLEGLSHEWSSSGKHNRQQLSQDPFQFAADTSHEMSHS
ncbi:MAG: TBC1 domain family member 4-like, partial [Trebouxia sp. A1-2]